MTAPLGALGTREHRVTLCHTLSHTEKDPGQLSQRRERMLGKLRRRRNIHI